MVFPESHSRPGKKVEHLGTTLSPKNCPASLKVQLNITFSKSDYPLFLTSFLLGVFPPLRFNSMSCKPQCGLPTPCARQSGRCRVDTVSCISVNQDLAKQSSQKNDSGEPKLCEGWEGTELGYPFLFSQI